MTPRDRPLEPWAFHAATPDLFVPAADGGGATVRLLLAPDAPVERGWLRCEPDNEERRVPLVEVHHRGSSRCFEATLPFATHDATTLYCFKLLGAEGQRWLAQDGLSRFFPQRALHFRWRPDYRPADWVADRIFYQIFPERFRNGDPSNDVQDGAYLYEGQPVVAKRWGERPDRRQGPREFYGGDLQGIVEGLDHIEALGADALYLNPIFVSPSSHKYDTVDYDRVDEHLGGNEALVALREATRARGVRLVLDAVVNHTSERHPWFDRTREHEAGGHRGAYAHPDSPTRGFYVFGDDDDPDSYEGWHGVRTLPVLDFSEPAVQEAIYGEGDSVLRRWLRPPYSVDGWRFDVIHMLGEGAGAANNHHHARAFRRAVREENEEAYLLGEHFFEASDWLRGDEEDGAMNYYGFTSPVLAFLAGVDFLGQPLQVDARDLDRLFARARGPLEPRILLSQLNLLGSHDTPRMLTRLGGDRARLRLAALLLFAYPGAPCVYYGDEIGMEGGPDPDCRRTFPWDEALWDHELLAHFRALAAARRASPALRRGGYATLAADGDAFAFARVRAGEVVVAAVNRGDAAVRLELSTAHLGLAPHAPLRDLLGGDAGTSMDTGGRVALELGPCQGVLLGTGG